MTFQKEGKPKINKLMFFIKTLEKEKQNKLKKIKEEIMQLRIGQ